MALFLQGGDDSVFGVNEWRVMVNGMRIRGQNRNKMLLPDYSDLIPACGFRTYNEAKCETRRRQPLNHTRTA